MDIHFFFIVGKMYECKKKDTMWPIYEYCNRVYVLGVPAQRYLSYGERFVYLGVNGYSMHSKCYDVKILTESADIRYMLLSDMDLENYFERVTSL